MAAAIEGGTLTPLRWPARLGRGPASFALVSDEVGTADAGIELLLGDGRRLRIRRGVDEATLRSVLAVVQGEEC